VSEALNGNRNALEQEVSFPVSDFSPEFIDVQLRSVDVEIKRVYYHVQCHKSWFVVEPLLLCHQLGDGSKKELTLLDAKRSNAINIGLTTLPPARTIRTAIFKMDSTIIGREQIEVPPTISHRPTRRDEIIGATTAEKLKGTYVQVEWVSILYPRNANKMLLH